MSNFSFNTIIGIIINKYLFILMQNIIEAKFAFSDTQF